MTQGPPRSDPPAATTPVVVDTDLGADDILAIAILVRDPELDVRAVTVAGTGLTHCAAGLRNLRNLLHQLGRDELPIACGREQPGPAGRLFPEAWRNAADAAYGLELPEVPLTTTPGDAVGVLTDALAGTDAPTTVVELGPWTNLQDLLAAKPEVAQRVAAVHAMGGTFDTAGNVAGDDGSLVVPAREWNLTADPAAVDAVLGLGLAVRLITLDATDRLPVDASLFERVRAGASAPGAAGANLAYELYERNPYLIGEGNYLWDPLAAVVLSRSDLVTWEETGVRIGTEPASAGQLVRDAAGPRVQATSGVAATSAYDAFLEALSRGAPRADPFVLAGEVTIGWDGERCAMSESPASGSGTYQLTFENGGSEVAAAAVLALAAGHDWQEVVDLAAGFDPAAGDVVPAWLRVAGPATAEAGGVGTTVISIPPGQVGPVCLVGSDYVVGDPVGIDP